MNQSVTKEQIIIPAHFQNLPAVRNFIARIAAKYRFTKSELNALTISVDEAITNIIKHGYGNILSGSITMNVNVKNDRLVVELIDQGISFDPNQVGDPNIPHYVQVRKKGGLGIFIIRKFMDDIQYVTTGQKNILRLIKLRKDCTTYPIFIPITSAFKRLKEKFFPAKNIK
ncbi:MAG TPA: ATP-binding protein [bacterium]